MKLDSSTDVDILAAKLVQQIPETDGHQQDAADAWVVSSEEASHAVQLQVVALDAEELFQPACEDLKLSLSPSDQPAAGLGEKICFATAVA